MAFLLLLFAGAKTVKWRFPQEIATLETAGNAYI
jgi:hypothetical protein